MISLSGRPARAVSIDPWRLFAQPTFRRRWFFLQLTATSEIRTCVPARVTSLDLLQHLLQLAFRELCHTTYRPMDRWSGQAVTQTLESRVWWRWLL